MSRKHFKRLSMKKTGFNGGFSADYDTGFSADYDATNVDNVVKTHKNLMKKNDIVL